MGAPTPSGRRILQTFRARRPEEERKRRGEGAGEVLSHGLVGHQFRGQPRFSARRAKTSDERDINTPLHHTYHCRPHYYMYNTSIWVHLKTWKPIWHYLLDTTVCNSYMIAHTTPQRPHADHWTSYSHKSFRNELVRELFKHSERLTEPSSGILGNNKAPTLAEHVRKAPAVEHGIRTRLEGPRQYCAVCTIQKRGVVAKKKESVTEAFW